MSRPQGTPKPVTLYAVAPNHAAWQAALWQDSRPEDAAVMARLGSVPTARWFVGQDADIEAAAHAYTTAAANANAVPVLVAYAIPNRDIGQYSRGGKDSPAAYQDWVAALARGIGELPAILILEPDALLHLGQLPGHERAARLEMLREATGILARLAPNTAVYIDGGNIGGLSPAEMADRLRAAGIHLTAGFSLNVSNFYTTEDTVRYGAALSGLLDDAHFVIDTSRNGNGPAPDQEWCNPGGRALGAPPTLRTGHPLVDAYLWVKVPGESDGTAGAAVDGTPPPAAGEWWPEYALQLAANAGWKPNLHQSPHLLIRRHNRYNR